MRIQDSDRSVALPMYDFDELASAHERLWAALAARLAAAGVSDVPLRLLRVPNHDELWRDPRLLLGQGCEFPLAKRYLDTIRLVATPHYAVPGCEGPRYRSAIVVARDHPARRLADLHGSRCVINSVDSNSGMNLLRAAIAPVARGASFFQSVTVSGAHRRSAEMIASGEADVAALDCVSFAHFQRLYPAMTAKLRVLDWTPTSPALPYITSGATSDATLEALRAALKQAIGDPALAATRAELYLIDVDIHPNPSFGEVLRLEQTAADLGYAELH